MTYSTIQSPNYLITQLPDYLTTKLPSSIPSFGYDTREEALLSKDSDDIAAILSPFIRVNIWTALHHHWQSPHAPFSLPPVAPTLWLVRRGTIHVSTPGREFLLTPGMLFLCPPGITRTIEVEGQGEWFSVGLTAQAFQRIDLFALLSLPGVRQPSESARGAFESLMGQAIQEWSGDSIPSSINPGLWFTYVQMRVMTRIRQFENRSVHLESELICEGIARSLFGLCWRHFAPSHLPTILQSNIPQWLAPVLRRADEDPAVAVTELAHAAHLSPARFRVVFHDWTGTSPQQYLTTRRMETARHLLLSTDETIASIASRIGMQSLPTFTRIFKATHGLAPGQYRQTFRRPSSVPDNFTSEKDK